MIVPTIVLACKVTEQILIRGGGHGLSHKLGGQATYFQLNYNISRGGWFLNSTSKRSVHNFEGGSTKSVLVIWVPHTMHASERNNSLVTEPSVLGSFTILVIFLPGAFLPFRLWQLHQELCLHWLFCQIRISLSSFKIGGWGVCAKKVATLKSPTGAGV